MRTRTQVTVVLASGLLLALGGCTVFNALDALGEGARDGGGNQPFGLPDTGAAADAQATDADATPAPEDDAGAAGPDAGLDAQGMDAEAGRPLAPPVFAEAGTKTWCDTADGGASALVFCADFDRTPLPSGFGGAEGAFLRLTSTAPSSPANGLVLDVPATSVPGTFASKLSKNFAQSAASVELAFDFDPQAVNVTSSGVLFAALDFVGNPSAKYSVRLAYNQGLVRVEESYLGFPSDVFHPSFDIPAGRWSRIRVALAFPDDAGTQGTLAVYLDDAIVGAREALSPPAGVDRRPSLLLGAVYGTSPHTGWLFHYDNVTLGLP